MGDEKKINICQPGFNASCALCCGSHNYHATLEDIEKIFDYRRDICTGIFRRPEPDADLIEELNCALNKKQIAKKLDDGIQCPFVGYTSPEGSIGCLAYFNNSFFKPALKDFFDKTCKNFSCLAKELLSDPEILYAAKITRDWFYYSLLINDIKLLRKLFDKYKNPEDIPGFELREVKNSLESMIS